MFSNLNIKQLLVFSFVVAVSTQALATPMSNTEQIKKDVFEGSRGQVAEGTRADRVTTRPSGDLRSDLFPTEGNVDKALQLITEKLNKKTPGLGNTFTNQFRRDLASGEIVLDDARRFGANRFYEENDDGTFTIAFNQSVNTNDTAHVIAMYSQHIEAHKEIENYMEHSSDQEYINDEARETISTLAMLDQNFTPRSNIILEYDELKNMFEYLAIAFYHKAVGLSLNQELAKAGVAHPDRSKLSNDRLFTRAIDDEYIKKVYGLGVVSFSASNALNNNSSNFRNNSNLNRRDSLDQSGLGDVGKRLLALIRHPSVNYDFEKYMAVIKSKEISPLFLREFATVNNLRVFDLNTRNIDRQLAARNNESYVDEFSLVNDMRRENGVAPRRTYQERRYIEDYHSPHQQPSSGFRVKANGRVGIGT